MRQMKKILAVFMVLAMATGLNGMAYGMELHTEAGSVSQNMEETAAPPEETTESMSGGDNEAAIIPEGPTDLTLEASSESVSAGAEESGEQLRLMQLKVAAELQEQVDGLKSLIPGEDYIEGEGVYLADTEAEAIKIAEEYGGTLESFAHGVAVVKFSGTTAEALEKAADGQSVTTAAGPNYICHFFDEKGESDIANATAIEEREMGSEMAAELSSGDPYSDSGSTNYQYFHEKINTDAAHQVTLGTGAKVAVIDTGTVADHEDLLYEDSAHVQYISSLANGTDAHGHGTHCAGVIGAIKDNNRGGYGVAPECELYSIRVTSGATFEMAALLEGLKIAIEDEVNVISMSLGGPASLPALEDLCKEAYEEGITLIAAAGNEGKDKKEYPGAYDTVIAVASTDRNDKLSYFSNYGSWVSVAAPGSDILSTCIYGNSGRVAGSKDSDSYADMSGTSMATPAVAGVAALCYASNEDLLNNRVSGTADAVKKAILESTDGVTYSYGSHSFKGLVQADAAVDAVKKASSSSSSNYNLLDIAGKHGKALKGTIAQGRKVKLEIEYGKEKLKDKDKKKAARAAEWSSSNSSIISVKKGKVKCSKTAAVGSKATISCKVGDQTLTYEYTVTEPAVALCYGTFKLKGKKVSVKISKRADLKTYSGREINLKDPNSLYSSRSIVLLYTKKDASRFTNNTYCKNADAKQDYVIDIPGKGLKNATVTTDGYGRPTKIKFNSAGKYKIKYKPSDGSKGSFTFKVDVS